MLPVSNQSTVNQSKAWFVGSFPIILNNFENKGIGIRATSFILVGHSALFGASEAIGKFRNDIHTNPTRYKKNTHQNFLM